MLLSGFLALYVCVLRVESSLYTFARRKGGVSLQAPACSPSRLGRRQARGHYGCLYTFSLVRFVFDSADGERREKETHHQHIRCKRVWGVNWKRKKEYQWWSTTASSRDWWVPVCQMKDPLGASPISKRIISKANAILLEYRLWSWFSLTIIHIQGGRYKHLGHWSKQFFIE